MLNGEPVISIGGQNYSSASNTIILPLNRGDQVWLQLYRGQLVELTDSWSSGAGYVMPMTSINLLFCVERLYDGKLKFQPDLIFDRLHESAIFYFTCCKCGNSFISGYYIVAKNGMK